MVSLLLAGMTAFATDWPQWRGPQRTDISKETGLLKEWPKDGPGLAWTFREAGAGYSGFAVVGDRLYSCGADEKDEYIFALSTKDGSKLWSTVFDTRFDNKPWGDGPRCTPTFDNGLLYALSGSGTLVCVKAENGDKVWSVSLVKDLGGNRPGWGYCESPLIDGDKLVCTPGGGKGTFAALDKKTGEVIWQSKKLHDGAAYSSIIAAEIGGVRQYINMTSAGEAAVAASDGGLLWQSDIAQNGTAIIPTPLVLDNQVFVTSGYGAGCGLLKITKGEDKFTAEKVYSNKDMENHHGGVILIDGYIYGHSNSKGWMCMDFKTGEVKWSSNGIGKGSLTCADGMLYCYSEGNGTVALVEPSPTAKWSVKGTFEIPEKTQMKPKNGAIWTHPVVANGKLYLRDQDLIFCYDVKGK
jgi:hypothetical protein